MKFRVQDLVKVSLLTALSIFLTRFLSINITPELRIGFGALPLILIGLFFNPVYAILAGLSADLIGIMIYVGGIPHFGFTVSSILTALIPSLICFYLFNKNYEKNQNLKILLSVISVYLIVHLIFNTLWLSQILKVPFSILINTRYLKVLIEGIVVIILTKILVSRLGKHIG